MKISIKQAKHLGNKFNIDFNYINFNEWCFGLNVELEHGKVLGKITNITNNNLDITAQITIAHLLEFPDYYKRLAIMEHKADLFWKNKKKIVFKK